MNGEIAVNTENVALITACGSLHEPMVSVMPQMNCSLSLIHS